MDALGVSMEIERLLGFGLEKGLLEKYDVIPARNSLLDLLCLQEPYYGESGPIPDSLAVILDNILDYACEKGILPEDTVTDRDLFAARIMGTMMPRQSEVIKKFRDTAAEKGIKQATDYFYRLSVDSGYIRMDRISKNLYWRGKTEYGDLEITINLSKPEKDPKEIASLKNLPQSRYPKCLLCIENVGFFGNANHPARQNHRVIPVTLNGEQWYFQYSPYVYYNEHCIVFKEEHVPMKLSGETFVRLFDFIDQFPHYFIGSNADIPIVGGSILVHEHFQGGRHIFPMEKAPVEVEFFHRDYDDVSTGIIKWPMPVIRLRGNNRKKLTDLAEKILYSWKDYSDESVDILAYTFKDGDKVSHNTITPIARKNSRGEYELDLVLRNNRTSKQHPEGIFHPHRELHHIKKENIGLIEVMGLAVLPGRLYDELAGIQKFLTGEDNYDREWLTVNQSRLVKHIPWIEELIGKYGTCLSKEQARLCLEDEVAYKFSMVLQDSGVFKRDKKGMDAFKKFMGSLGFR